MNTLDLSIDTDGTLERVMREMATMPEGIDRARKRALRKLSTWIKRQILREAASAAGTTQKVLSALLRYRTTSTADELRVWLGTNPINANNLGTVRWTRRMVGARVGRRLFAGTWSWADSRRMAGLVVQRQTEARLPVEVVTVPVHDAVLARLQALQPAIDARFRALLVQELNYALRVEGAR